MRILRACSSTAKPRWLWLFAGVLSLAAGGCLPGDLPSVVSRNSAVPDAATAAQPPASGSPEDASVIVLSAQTDASVDDVQGIGRIELTVGLPFDTTTGEVLSLGSLHIQLSTSDRAASRLLTLQLNQPPSAINLNLEGVTAGESYVLSISATPASGAACAGASPPFVVPAGQTVRVFEALVCSGDAGSSATLYDPGPAL